MPDTASDPNVAENNQQDDRLKDDKVVHQVMGEISRHVILSPYRARSVELERDVCLADDSSRRGASRQE
jgi:hypothetical protein